MGPARSVCSPRRVGLTVEQLLLLVALGVVFPGVPAWGTVKAGRLPDSLWPPWLSSAAQGWPGGRMALL